MKLHFLGTCAGTEPMPNRQHASVAVEAAGRLYWFDAGEGCARTAHLMGLDLLKIGKIVISHPHMDHVGGLANLLWHIRKITTMTQGQPEQGAVETFIPNMETWEGIMLILRNTECCFRTTFPVTATQVEAGVLFDDGIMKVTAFPNRHMAMWESGHCLSYSYLIECEGKRVVYSGDVAEYEELDPLIGNGCDGLVIETGHFGIDTAYEYLEQKNVKRIFFSHSGREILNHPEASQDKIRRYFHGRAVICEDGMSVDLTAE